MEAAERQQVHHGRNLGDGAKMKSLSTCWIITGSERVPCTHDSNVKDARAMFARALFQVLSLQDKNSVHGRYMPDHAALVDDMLDVAEFADYFASNIKFMNGVNSRVSIAEAAYEASKGKAPTGEARSDIQNRVIVDMMLDHKFDKNDKSAKKYRDM
jgi:hypothetical protein